MGGKEGGGPQRRKKGGGEGKGLFTGVPHVPSSSTSISLSKEGGKKEKPEERKGGRGGGEEWKEYLLSSSYLNPEAGRKRSEEKGEGNLSYL